MDELRAFRGITFAVTFTIFLILVFFELYWIALILIPILYGVQTTTIIEQHKTSGADKEGDEKAQTSPSQTVPKTKEKR